MMIRSLSRRALRLPSLPTSIALALLAVAFPPTVVRGEEKKPDKPKEPPTVLLANPITIARGKSALVKFRGLRLSEATAVRLPDSPGTTVAIKSKGKADLPNKVEAKVGGDTQVEVEFTAPADAKGDTLAVVIMTPDGETTPYVLRLADPATLVAEKEPNNGFREAQPIPSPDKLQRIQGSIQDPNDVDVFRIEAKAGQTLSAEVFAARQGSVLDGILTLYDEKGRILATVDDTAASHDPLLTLKLPSDGVYFLALTDALETGGQTHPYELALDLE